MNIIFNEIKNGTLSIDIVGTIGTSIFDDTFNSNTLKDKLSESENYDTIILNISSLGGSAYEGLNIFNMLEFEKSKGKKVICNIIGAVASAAVTISLSADERNMLENSLMLIHKVSGMVEGKKEDIEEQLKQMEALNTNLINIYSQKTGLPKEEISKIMDQEKWLSAKEALKLGLITNVIKPSKVKNKEINMESIINQINESDLPKVNLETTETENTEVTSEVETNVIDEVVEPINNEQVITDEVVEPINTEVDTIVDTINEVSNLVDINNLNLELSQKNTQISTLTNEVNNLTNKVKELEKTIRNKEIEDILNTAIKQDKISSSLKNEYRNLLEVNFDLTKELISKLNPNKSISLTSQITEEEVDTKFNWTIRDWERNDPNGLRELKSSNPEKYNKLFDSFYKK